MAAAGVIHAAAAAVARCHFRVTIPCMSPRITFAPLLPLLLAPGPAAAWSPLGEVVCAPRPAMVERLERDQRATLRATGLREGGTLIEVWAAEDGGWTLVQSYAGGTACIVAMGADWDQARPPA